MNWFTHRHSRNRRYDELSESIREHLDEKIADLMDRGMTREQAESTARREFGNVAKIEERSREVWQWPNLENIWADVRFASRQLRKSPGFAITAILTLALGIGATTAVFSVVNSVVLQPLAFRDAGQLVAINEIVQEFVKQFPLLPVNAKQFQYWNERAHLFSGITLLHMKDETLLQPHGRPQLIGGVEVLPNFFSLLGVNPTLGRGFLSSETQKGGNNVAIITNGLWRREFQADPAIIGKQVSINGELLTIIGVLPSTFHFPVVHSAVSMASGEARPVELFTPLTIDFNNSPAMGSFNFLGLGRLKPGVPLAEAQTELTGLLRAFTAEQIKVPVHLSAKLEVLQQNVVGSSGRALWLLLAAVLSVLLIACVNLANLQLVRAVVRDRDTALRAALGASRLRLIQVALAESILLGTIGGIIGIAFAFFTVRLFVHSAPLTIPRLNEVHVDLTVLAVALVMTAGTVVLSGLMPVLRSLRIEPLEALKTNSSQSGSNRRMAQMRAILVAAEIGGTTVLLMMCALVLHSFMNALHTPRGFDADHVTIAEVDLFEQSYQEDKTRIAFDEEVLRRLKVLPGVKSVSLTQVMPLTGDQYVTDVQRAGIPLVPTEAPLMNFRYISPGYFSTLQIPVIDGRMLEPQDRDKKHVVLSETAALMFWPKDRAVGQTVVMNDGGPANTYTVVGVASNARTQHLKSAPGPMIYQMFTENPPHATYFLIRSSQPANAMASAIRQQIWQVDRQVAIPTVTSLDDQVAGSLNAEHLESLLLASFALAAIVLAILGIYGVLAYSVASKTRDIGLRIAFGANHTNIYRMVFVQAALPVAAGLFGGMLTAIVIAHTIRSLLYDVSALDPVAMLFAVGLISVAAFVAAILPAQRAARTDPLQALRME